MRLVPSRFRSLTDQLRTAARSALRMRIDPFKILEIETCSTCNRTCPGCIRNSHPDRDRVQTWFAPNRLPTDTIHRILREAADMGFRGQVCLQHYNEPLMDDRIDELGAHARGLGVFSEVFICTNADYLSPERAARLDGVFDRLLVALYMDEPKKSERAAWVRSLFSKTRLEFTGGVHIPTHFSPTFDAPALAKEYEEHPCSLPTDRMIINHKGDMLLCCDDMVGNFDLGNIHHSTISELWYGDKHQQIVRDLLVAGGRKKHAYCASCPRP